VLRPVTECAPARGLAPDEQAEIKRLGQRDILRAATVFFEPTAAHLAVPLPGVEGAYLVGHQRADAVAVLLLEPFELIDPALQLFMTGG